MNAWLREIEDLELGAVIASCQIGEEELADFCAGSEGESAERHFSQRARRDGLSP